MCSTPFGIKDRGGNCAFSTFNSSVSAQRLSASKIVADLRSRASQSFPMCSTPFGIKDRGGLRVQSVMRVQIVLNAFRHQRSWRPECMIALLSPGGAQRLSASKIVADIKLQALNWKRMCSTPFGIKDRGGLCFPAVLIFQKVLNAFRHQRSWRSSHIL